MGTVPTPAEKELAAAAALTEAQLERCLDVASDMLGHRVEASEPLVHSLLIAMAINQQTLATRGPGAQTYLTARR